MAARYRNPPPKTNKINTSFQPNLILLYSGKCKRLEMSAKDSVIASQG